MYLPYLEAVSCILSAAFSSLLLAFGLSPDYASCLLPPCRHQSSCRLPSCFAATSRQSDLRLPGWAPKPVHCGQGHVRNRSTKLDLFPNLVCCCVRYVQSYRGKSCTACCGWKDACFVRLYEAGGLLTDLVRLGRLAGMSDYAKLQRLVGLSIVRWSHMRSAVLTLAAPPVDAQDPCQTRE